METNISIHNHFSSNNIEMQRKKKTFSNLIDDSVDAEKYNFHYSVEADFSIFSIFKRLIQSFQLSITPRSSIYLTKASVYS